MKSWKATEPYFLSLFPAFKGQYQEGGFEQLYAKVLDKVPPEPLRKAIDIHAAKSHYAPRPKEILTTARLFMPAKLPEQTGPSKVQQAKLAAKSWEDAATLVLAIGKKDAAQHRQTVLDTDWRMAHLKNHDLMSKAWVAIISQRIEENVLPDQPSKGIPPCPSPKSKDSNGETSSDQVMSPPSSE